MQVFLQIFSTTFAESKINIISILTMTKLYSKTALPISTSTWKHEYFSFLPIWWKRWWNILSLFLWSCISNPGLHACQDKHSITYFPSAFLWTKVSIYWPFLFHTHISVALFLTGLPSCEFGGAHYTLMYFYIMCLLMLTYVKHFLLVCHVSNLYSFQKFLNFYVIKFFAAFGFYTSF